VRIVVSGGAGFIGSHIVGQLAEAGHAVAVLDSLDRMSHPTADAAALPAGVELHRVNIREPASWLPLVDGADAVCHQAARVGLGLDFADVREYVDHNDAGTAAMLWSLHRARFRGRLVLASSMVVYGEGAYVCSRHGPQQPGPRRSADLEAGRFEPSCALCDGALTWRPVGEDAPMQPRNVYAATKVHQEHLCAAFGREHDIPVTALRYHNVYGPRMPRDTPYSGVASIFRSALEAGRPPVVFEDGAQLRDFVHVDDVARANVLALTAPEPYDGPLNVASGHPWTLLDMARAVSTGAAGSHRPGRGRALSPVVSGRYRLGDVRHIVASPDRAREVLGFRAGVHPADGLARFATDPLRAAI